MGKSYTHLYSGPALFGNFNRRNKSLLLGKIQSLVVHVYQAEGVPGIVLLQKKGEWGGFCWWRLNMYPSGKRKHMDLITPLFLLPDICACLKNATFPGVVQKTNVVVNFSKDSNGEAEAQAMQWFLMWPWGVPGASQKKVISGDAVWWNQWEVDPREQLDCRNMFSNLLTQIAALPIPDVHKSQEKPEKGLILVKNLNLRF